jgi:ABC-type transporter MlaC component
MRAILYRVVPAMTAMKLDQTPPEIIEQMRKDTSAAAKEGLKRFEDTKAAFSQIPSANRQLVAAHLQELLEIQRLGR